MSAARTPQPPVTAMPLQSPTPTMRLLAWDEATGETLFKLRQQAVGAGPLDRKTCELIAIAGFAILGYEGSFKTHAQRLVDMGEPKAVLQHAVGTTLGATTVVFQVARALQWIDELMPDDAA